MANEQFPMYNVKPHPVWARLTPGPGITAKELAQLTTYMRNVLYDAMGEAVLDTKARSSLNSRRGRIWSALMTGRRAKGTLVPASVQVTFMVRSWMAIHETGGTIRPKTKKYLALPMPDAYRADGFLKRRSPSGWKDYGTFVYTSKKSGKKFLVYRSKTAGKLVFLYHLTDKVEMQQSMDLYGSIMRQEAQVVSLWTSAVLDIFNGIDLYGVAFEGLKVN